MPVVPNFLERLVLLNANQAPAPLLDLIGAVGLKVVATAMRLGVFAALESDAASPARVAESAGLDAELTGSLLRLLEASGYVKEHDSQFELTPMSKKWMLPTSHAPFGDFLRFYDEVVLPFWDEHLEDALITGAPAQDLYENMSAEQWLVGQAGMEALARLIMPDVVRKLALPAQGGRLLDLGGGHGLYAIELCRATPGWTATVVDSLPALVAAARNIEATSMSGTVRVMEGDALADPIGSEYDAVLLFNLIHGFSPDENKTVLERVFSGLNPGGLVAILEQFDRELPGNLGAYGPRLLDFVYRVGLRSRIYQLDEVKGLLSDAGFENVRVKGLLRAPGNSLVTATRP